MNRADRMLYVLRDGKPKSRREIQHVAGYFLTNNAASELRKRGLVVKHWREGMTDYYQLAAPLTHPEVADIRGDTLSLPSEPDIPPVTGPASGYVSGAVETALPQCLPVGLPSVPPVCHDRPAQLTMEVAA